MISKDMTGDLTVYSGINIMKIRNLSHGPRVCGMLVCVTIPSIPRVQKFHQVVHWVEE